MRDNQDRAASTATLSKTMLVAIASGTLLNPLNSSMIAVALVTIAKAYSVGIPSVTWLVSGFYLAAAVGQPLMGRLADIFGPRRLFLFGLLIVLCAGILGPFAPSLGALVAIRVLQAFGTSTAYPSGLTMIRRAAGNPEKPPAGALGLLSVAANVSAALGPTLGGAIIAFADWQGIFAVNIVLVVIAFPLALRFLPPDPPRGERRRETAGRRGLPVDIPGILLFGGALTSLLVFLLSLSRHIHWLFLPLAALLGVTFVIWENRSSDPFIDISIFRSGGGLRRVYGTFASMNTVFYSLFFGLPLWLEEAHGFHADVAGLLMLPFAGLGVIATPIAARLIRVRSVRLVIVTGMITMALGSLLLLFLRTGSPIAVILAITIVLGIPNAFNNLGLQAALFQAAPADKIGSASGLFQTSRYVGTFLSSALLGIIFGGQADTRELHILAAVLTAVSITLLLVSLLGRNRAPR